MLYREVTESTLGNGLQILTAVNRTSPTATVQVWYRVGSRNERTGITGISHIFEHMMFKGTRRFPRGAFDRLVQENGMSYNAFTSHDFTAYFEVMSKDRLAISMELESDRMQGLLLDPDEFASEIAVIREERRQTREDPPFGLLMEAVEASMFTAHPYHWPVIGWMSDLYTITVDDLRAYYGDYYRPNNATLIVAGDVDPAAVHDLADRYFGSIARGPELAPVLIREPRQLGERTVSIRKAVQLPGLVMAYRTPAGNTREAKVLEVIESILLHGRSSRLYQSLVHRKQLAIGLSGGFHMRIDPSSFYFRATARPGVTIESLREEILAEVDALRDGYVTPEELAKAQRAIEVEYLFSQESNEELAQQLGACACRGDWRDALTYVADRRSVTAEEVQRVAGEIFDPTQRTVGLLVPDADAPGPRSYFEEETEDDLVLEESALMDRARARTNPPLVSSAYRRNVR